MILLSITVAGYTLSLIRAEDDDDFEEPVSEEEEEENDREADRQRRYGETDSVSATLELDGQPDAGELFASPLRARDQFGFTHERLPRAGVNK